MKKLFIDPDPRAPILPTIKEYGQDSPCKKCGGETVLGYGFAGGELGAYLYCASCERFLAVQPDPEY